MKVLITGFSGLVGNAISKKFIEEGHEVLALVRQNNYAPSAGITYKVGDLSDIFSLEDALQGADYVVHAAGLVSFAPKDNKLLEKTNIEGTKNLVDACLNKNIKKFCFISSVAALGRPVLKKNTKIIIDENQAWQESDLNSNYAISKYLAEIEVWRGQAEGLNTVIMNPSIILGEGDIHKSSTQLFKYVKDQNYFYPSGKLNYVDVNDLAEVCYQLCFSSISDQRFVVSAGSVTYKDFFENCAQKLNCKAPQYLLKGLLVSVLWRFEKIRSIITQKAPLITKETAKVSGVEIEYDSNKIKKALGFEFRPLNDTLSRVCEFLSKEN